MENHNIVEFKPRNGYEDILFFLNGLESENTYTRYKAAIERFIRRRYDIPLQHVHPEHFNSLSYTDTKKYRDWLRKKDYAASTINNEMAVLFNLMKELNKIERNGKYVYNIKVDQLRTKSLRIKEVNSAGYITWEETDEWIEYLKALPKRSHPMRKSTYIHISRITGLRKDAMVNLVYRDLRKSGNIWQIKSVLKGKTTKISIKEEDAQMMFELWENKGDKDEKIFKMSGKTIDRLIEHLKEKFDIAPERNVTVHSLRGLSIYEVYLATNDILASQRHANHSNLETTFNYVKGRNDESVQPSLYLGKSFDGNDVDKLDDAQWKNIYHELSRSAKYEILRAMEKLGYSQEK